MAVDHALEDVGEPGIWLDAVSLAVSIREQMVAQRLAPLSELTRQACRSAAARCEEYDRYPGRAADPPR